MAWMLWWAAGSAWAQTADEVVAMVRESNQVDSAIEKLRMTLLDKRGNTRVRELEIRARREGGLSKTRLAFTSPSDLVGLTLLQIDGPGDRDDEQWVHSAGRTNRIAGSQTQGRFASSDFTFEDLRIRDAVEGTHTLASTTEEAWVIDTIPPEGSSYARIRTTVGRADRGVRQIELYGPSGPVKRLDVVRTERVGEALLPVETVMHDLERGSQTRLEIVSYQLGVGPKELPDETFTPASLER